MLKTLIRFWLRRFALVFVLACLGLGALELIAHGLDRFAYGSVLGWSLAAAIFASSTATYWSYRIRCKRVFR